MTLVEVRCAASGCRRLLASIADPLPPEALRGTAYRVRPCKRHHATLEGWLRLAREGRTVRLGFGPVRVPGIVLWSLIDMARRTGRTQEYAI